MGTKRTKGTARYKHNKRRIAPSRRLLNDIIEQIFWYVKSQYGKDPQRRVKIIYFQIRGK